MDEEFDLKPAAPELLTIAIDGWEGPLDLLLTLARTQKVDLKQISILALVDQYIGFVNEARALKLELAADYLVMAAWLAYLKSALLLPRDPDVEPSAEELALRLQLRLQRLDAMREAGARLMARDRIGRDVFLRGAPEGLRVVRRPKWEASLYELIAAYGVVKARTQPAFHVVARRMVMTLEEAIELVARMVGQKLDWASLESFLPTGLTPGHHRSVIASSFVAALELARQGRLQLAQDSAFTPLMVKAA
ncbi:MAG TPA: ScpA family protein [Sphingomonas sp.]|nr:ScpA family protein [Sphingomonas sp.]